MNVHDLPSAIYLLKHGCLDTKALNWFVLVRPLRLCLFRDQAGCLIAARCASLDHTRSRFGKLDVAGQMMRGVLTLGLGVTAFKDHYIVRQQHQRGFAITAL